MASTTDLFHSSFGASINNGHTYHKAKKTKRKNENTKNEKTKGFGEERGSLGCVAPGG